MKTTRINLLPWRDIERRERDKKILFSGSVMWALCGIAVLFGYLWMNNSIVYQQKKNSFLSAEISTVEKDIEEINDIRERKENLLARMNIIQQLQLDRTQVVHVFDDVVQKLPKGVYFTKMVKEGRQMKLEGLAQSYARVSTLMRNLESSDWFDAAELDVINTTEDEGGGRLSEFTLKVQQASPELDTAATDDAKAEAPSSDQQQFTPFASMSQ